MTNLERQSRYGTTIAGADDQGGSPCDRRVGAPVRRLGDFELLRPLGRGAMGVVYEARQVSLNRRVAVKMIRAGAFATEAEVQRFQNEAEAVAQLDHPRIVPIHEVSRIEDCHYFSMKLMRGGSLAHRLDSYRSNPQAAVRILIEVARGIQHAHQQGILHRDLKPANILLDEHDLPRVTDFGLAKRFGDDSSLTESGAILGTPSYMSPEQAAGHKGLVTTLADVYGLGAVLYAMLTGQPPFLAETVIETIEQVRHRPPVPPSRLNPQVNRDLETICLKCLEKEASRRYISAEALAEDLQRWLDGEPIAARPVGATVRAWMWCRRNPIVAGLLAASLLLTLGTTWQWQRAEGLLLKAKYDESSTAIDQALGLCEQGKVASGMLQLAQVLETAPSNAADLKRAARVNLVAWSRYNTSLISLMKHSNEVHLVAFSPDGRTALTQCPDRIARLWDAATGETCGEPLHHHGAIICSAFSPNSRLVATGSLDGRARFWEVPSGRPLGGPLLHGGPVRSVAFSPDSRRLLTGSNDGTAREWNVADQQQAKPLGNLGSVYEVAFGLDGRVALIGTDKGFVQRWDLPARRTIGRSLAIHQLHGRDYRPTSVFAWSADGTRILTNGAFQSDRTGALLWDAINDQEIAALRHEGHVQSVAFSGNGKVAITGSGDRTARLWDAATGKMLGEPLRHQAPVLAVALNFEGTMALTGSEDRTARLWEVATGKPWGDPLCHPDFVQSVAFRPDGRAILTGCADHHARLWTLGALARPDPTACEDGEGILARPPHVAYSPPPDRALALTGNSDGTAWIRDAATNQAMGSPLGLTSAVLSVAWSPDGALLLTGGIDGTAQVWLASTRLPIGQPMTHKGPIHSVAFSPDSRQVVTASADRSARLWDATTGKPIGPSLDHDRAVTAAAFSTDGKFILTRTDDSVMRRWERTPAIAGPDERFLVWAQVVTGSRINAHGVVQALDPMDWNQRTERLQVLGGAPSPENSDGIEHEAKAP